MLSEPAAAPAIEVAGASVALGGRPVLRGVDLTVPAGEFIALMGENGSGKSTLVRAMTGLWPLTAGRVCLFGVPLGDFRDWHRVGFVPQRIGATGGVPASVREVVTSGRLSRRRLLRPMTTRDRRAVEEALEAVGLTDHADRGVSALSGGQQQRVLIARALAGGGDLFLLDEPTAGVDVLQQEALADTLRLMAVRGATVVLVAHELGPMAPLVDRVVVMRDGRVGYDGPPASAVVPGHGQAGDHHGEVLPHDHAPHVAAPLDVSGPVAGPEEGMPR